MKIGTTRDIGYIENNNYNNNYNNSSEPKVSLESFDTVSLSTSQKPKKYY